MWVQVTTLEFRGLEQQPSANKDLDKSIRDLALTVRSYHYLDLEGIRTVRDLVQKTEREILKIRNLGRKSLKEIKETLYGMNLILGMSPDVLPKPPASNEKWEHSEAYLTPRSVVAVLGTKTINGQECRQVVLQGGHTLWVLEGPDNMTKLLELLERGAQAWQSTIVYDAPAGVRPAADMRYRGRG